jgi:CheY-specific phosphatase CheX
MAIKVFGQFLLEKKVITTESLAKALKHQETKNLKLGEMALAMGFITAADIERAHEAQKREDLKLGEMLVKLGILDEERLQQVITMQKNTHLFIGEALVQVGALTAAELYCHLEEFKLDQAPYQVTRIMIPAGASHPGLLEIVADLTYKMFTRVVGLTFKQGQCQIINGLELADLTAAIDLSGDAKGTYLLSVSDDIRLMIAKAILKESEVEGLSAELIDDAVMEFANIVCGNIAAKAAQQDIQLSISPPLSLGSPGETLQVPAGRTGLLFPIYVTDFRRVEMAVYIGD